MSANNYTTVERMCKAALKRQKVSYLHHEGQAWLTNGHWLVMLDEAEIPGQIRVEGEGCYTGRLSELKRMGDPLRVGSLIPPAETLKPLAWLSHITSGSTYRLMWQRPGAHDAFVLENGETGVDRSYVEDLESIKPLANWYRSKAPDSPLALVEEGGGRYSTATVVALLMPIVAG